MSRVPQFALPALAALALVSAMPDRTRESRPSPAENTPAASIVFADTAQLSARSCDDTRLRAILMNSGSTNVDAKLELIEAGSVTAEPRSAAVEPGRSVVAITIKRDQPGCASWLSAIVRPAPMAAYLGVTGPNGRRDLRPVRIADPSPVNWLALIGGLALSLIVVRSATPKALPTDLVLTQPIWGTSSASNLGLGAALLTALLGMVPALETMRFADRSTYTQLSLLFGALLAASPLVFGLRDAKDSIQAFLTAATLTLWGAFGQLLAAAFMLVDLRAAGALPGITAVIFELLCLSLIGYLITYTRRAIPRILTPPARARVDSAGVSSELVTRPWTLL